MAVAKKVVPEVKYIKFRLEVWNKTVLFQVLEMNETFRATTMNKALYSSTLGRLWSAGAIEISGDCNIPNVYLRGSTKVSDFDVARRAFPTPEQAINYKENVLILLNAWVKAEEDKKTMVVPKVKDKDCSSIYNL